MIVALFASLACNTVLIILGGFAVRAYRVGHRTGQKVGTAKAVLVINAATDLPQNMRTLLLGRIEKMEKK